MTLTNSRRVALCALTCASYAASQTTVRVDDSNVYSTTNPTGIQYSSVGWSSIATGDASQRYQGTYMENKVFGSQLWFAFQGNAITYYADRNPGFGAVTLSIDGGDNINLNWTNPSPGVLYQQSIWNIDNLGPGDHTLVIGNTNVNNASIGLDYLSITSNGNDIRPVGYGPGASSVAPGAILVDNESNEVSYSGTAWERWSSSANTTIQSRYFNRTEHCAETPGSVATFNFNGTAVWYFADDYSGNSKVSLSIDGGEGQVVDTATTGNAWTSQRLFWNATGLTPERHTLTVTHVGANQDYACVDFFMYLPSSASPITPNPSTTPTPSPQQSTKSPTPIGAIVGGVVGGIIALVLIAILILLVLRRRQPVPNQNEPRHETYTGEEAYQTKQVDPSYHANNMGPVPSVGYDQRPYSPYGNLGGGGSIAPTNWSGPTYKGHPELQ